MSAVVPRVRRQRHHAEVLHPDHGHVVEIPDRVQATDRLGVRVVVRLGPVEAQRPHQAPALVLIAGEAADAPRLYQHQAGVVDAPPPRPARKS